MCLLEHDENSGNVCQSVRVCIKWSGVVRHWAYKHMFYRASVSTPEGVWPQDPFCTCLPEVFPLSRCGQNPSRIGSCRHLEHCLPLRPYWPSTLKLFLQLALMSAGLVSVNFQSYCQGRIDLWFGELKANKFCFGIVYRNGGVFKVSNWEGVKALPLLKQILVNMLITWNCALSGLYC